ncbi:MAG: tRNA (adenosine(37)-N6)-threonylcarbamoyltransferase complex ATPase subunit type 1 TsaE [Desulfovibrio sp.]|nr:tRNA (adenosine(37)-N6)-threonylcarbamoyltransferase complex ATPase subunit type 1 TsaE [Desulfovibrio sp.]
MRGSNALASMLIATLAELNRLGDSLAQALTACSCPPLLLYGPLGAGKTALTASICRAWPGCANAEVASPSFTVCNIYPGQPQILHCDLYRSHALPEEVWEIADDGQLIVEWAEFLADPGPRHLDIYFNVVNDSRLLTCKAFGSDARAALTALAADWPDPDAPGAGG